MILNFESRRTKRIRPLGPFEIFLSIKQTVKLGALEFLNELRSVPEIISLRYSLWQHLEPHHRNTSFLLAGTRADKLCEHFYYVHLVFIQVQMRYNGGSLTV